MNIGDKYYIKQDHHSATDVNCLLTVNFMDNSRMDVIHSQSLHELLIVRHPRWNRAETDDGFRMIVIDGYCGQVLETSRDFNSSYRHALDAGYGKTRIDLVQHVFGNDSEWLIKLPYTRKRKTRKAAASFKQPDTPLELLCQIYCSDQLGGCIDVFYDRQSNILTITRKGVASNFNGFKMKPDGDFSCIELDGQTGAVLGQVALIKKLEETMRSFSIFAWIRRKLSEWYKWWVNEINDELSMRA